MVAMRYLLLLTIMLSSDWALAQDHPGVTDFSAAERLAIQNVIASHFLNLDSFEIDTWMTNFAPGATFVAESGNNRYEWDRAEFEKFFRERFKGFKREGKQRRHIISNILFVEQANQSARVMAKGLLLSTTRGGPAELVGGLTYEGVFIKNEGEWRIAKWTVRADTHSKLDDAGGARVSEINKD